MTTARHLVIILMLGLLAFCTGCDDAEEALNNIPTPADDPAVQLVAAEGVEMASALMATLPDLASGALGSKSIDEAYYDETCTCWYWSDYEGSETGNTYWARYANYQATFYAGEVAQQAFEGADRIVMVFSFYYEWSEYEGEVYSAKSMAVNVDLEITGLGVEPMLAGGKVGPITTTGDGTGHVSGGTGNYEDEEWDGFYEEFDVDVGFTTPIPGCPSGSIDLTTEEATFHMGFNGTATGSWSYKLGSTTVDSGTFPLGCSTK